MKHNAHYWEIAKEFDFCYGHRVWSQMLNTEFSLDGRCVCRHNHGHQGKLLIYLKGINLSSGMVTDFKHLNWLKKFIDDTLDHKTILDENDPWLEDFLSPVDRWYREGDGTRVRHLESIGPCKVVPRSCWPKALPLHLQELLEGLVVVDFVPTSENLCKWLAEIASKKMADLGVEVSRVQFFETPKSQANYYCEAA